MPVSSFGPSPEDRVPATLAVEVRDGPTSYGKYMTSDFFSVLLFQSRAVCLPHVSIERFPSLVCAVYMLSLVSLFQAFGSMQSSVSTETTSRRKSYSPIAVGSRIPALGGQAALQHMAQQFQFFLKNPWRKRLGRFPGSLQT